MSSGEEFGDIVGEEFLKEQREIDTRTDKK